MKFHNTRVNENGANIDRKKLDFNEVSNKDFGIIPFRAVVVAYYAKSQMVDVIYPRIGGLGFLSGVDVYGNHGNLLGTISTPDLAVKKTADGYNLSPDNDINKVEIGDQKNNIECLVKRTTEGFATSEFRAFDEANPMWLNSKPGRRISTYSDGSYSVQDKDGNHEFVHCSGLRIKIGDSPDTIAIEDKLGIHEANKSGYTNKTNFIVEHPLLSGKIGFDSTGKLISENSNGKLGLDILEASIEEITKIIDEISKIIVAQGTGPDIAALTAIKNSLVSIGTKTGQIYG